ncbi:MAG: hypothetical protein MI754_00765 [Chromatiales bacterium]|nr:hypothetical protein [Chromatiales bacterium]
MKSVPISVRISPTEAEFLAQLKIPDAITPSDKLRAIITDARKRTESPQSYTEASTMIHNWLSPIFENVHEAEITTGQYSALVAITKEWLQEFLTYTSLAGSFENNTSAQQNLESFEQGVAERTLRLSENLLQLALTKESRCYQADVISSRLQPIQEIAKLILELDTPTKEIS